MRKRLLSSVTTATTSTESVSVNSTTTLIYVAGSGNNSIDVVDHAAGILSSIPVAFSPFTIRELLGGAGAANPFNTDVVHSQTFYVGSVPEPGPGLPIGGALVMLGLPHPRRKRSLNKPEVKL